MPHSSRQHFVHHYDDTIKSITSLIMDDESSFMASIRILRTNRLAAIQSDSETDHNSDESESDDFETAILLSPCSTARSGYFNDTDNDAELICSNKNKLNKLKVSSSTQTDKASCLTCESAYFAKIRSAGLTKSINESTTPTLHELPSLLPSSSKCIKTTDNLDVSNQFNPLSPRASQKLDLIKSQRAIDIGRVMSPDEFEQEMTIALTNVRSRRPVDMPQLISERFR